MRASHPERRTPTFRQFTMVLAAVTWFALLLPVGARATASLVTLVDPQTSVKAQVDEPGALRVAEFNDPARLPVRRDRLVLVDVGAYIYTVPLTTVPTGYELVIDTVSVSAYVPTGQQPIMARINYHNSTNGHFWIPLSFAGSLSGRNYYQGAERVQLYVDPEHTIDVTFQRNATTGIATAAFSVSGHLMRL